ncbi:MAG: hypothetical protein U5L45_11105 [Saprospiraceae bacterium]|nr:hypothetical protein [Saprospiraceae bacterium]
MAEKHPIDLDLLAETYNIQRVGDCQDLDEWLSAKYDLTVFEQTLFDNIFSKTKDNVNYFNEEELKMHLISPLFLIADINVPKKIRVFFERPLKTVLNNFLLSVNCDCMAATPMQFNKPKRPYFFLQEYKKSKGDDKDPEAQMLAAMIIAQHQNNDGLPLFGSYIIGSHWYFTTLVGENYCSSREFDADDNDDLLQVVFILKKLKDILILRP